MKLRIGILAKLSCLLILGPMLRSSAAKKVCLDPYHRKGVCMPFDKCEDLTDMRTAYPQAKHRPQKINAFYKQSRKACDIYNDPSKPDEKTFCCYRPDYSCGVVEVNRIANGVDAELFAHPWMARLLWNNTGTCGGSLIDEYNVLTAAHCVEKRTSPTHVVLGEYDTGKNKDCTVGGKIRCADPVQKIRVEKCVTHEHYTSQHSINDIAIIHLEEPAILNDNVSPICLPSVHTPRPENLTITGWGGIEKGGTARVLQMGYVQLTKRTNCDINPSDTTKLCVQSTSDVGSCRGDSGGPLFGLVQFHNIKRYYQFGVMIVGSHKCNGKQPSEMAHVVRYEDWIEKNIKNVNKH